MRVVGCPWRRFGRLLLAQERAADHKLGTLCFSFVLQRFRFLTHFGQVMSFVQASRARCCRSVVSSGMLCYGVCVQVSFVPASGGPRRPL
eukprot:9858269-Alexandrium_andersonii.AAC.1